MSPKRILIVDDNEDNRFLLKHQLRKTGDFEILEATHGQEALEMVLWEPLDLIFMDLKMPVLNGWETIGHIRALEGPRREVPIIAYTAYAVIGDEQNAQEAGCDDFIAKPLMNHDLIQKKVERLLAKNGSQQQP